MATLSSGVLAWEIPLTEKSGRMQFMVHRRVRYSLATKKTTTFHCGYISHILYPSIDGHLRCFQILTITNNASMKIVHICF